LFAQRVADYRVSVRLCTPDAASVALSELIAAGDQLVVPDGFPQERGRGRARPTDTARHRAERLILD
jgi:hypothetical protein